MKASLPEDLRPLLWSYEFEKIDPVKNKKTIVLQAINYGTMAQWSWLLQTYGHDGVREVLSTVPATSIRPQARRLAALVFGIEHFNHASRGAH